MLYHSNNNEWGWGISLDAALLSVLCSFPAVQTDRARSSEAPHLPSLSPFLPPRQATLTQQGFCLYGSPAHTSVMRVNKQRGPKVSEAHRIKEGTGG